MQVITMESEAFKSLKEQLERIEAKSAPTPQSPENTWLDNQEMCQLLKVTPRTLQNYRDQKLIPFTQLGGKIFYRQSDIFKALEKNQTVVNQNKEK